jgi:hypothetical protein
LQVQQQPQQLATFPANSQVISVVLSVTTANDDGTASTVAIGTAADDNAFLAATSVQSTGTTFSGVMTSASADVGTSDVAIIATFTATDGDGTAGCCSCYSDVCPKQQSVDKGINHGWSSKGLFTSSSDRRFHYWGIAC